MEIADIQDAIQTQYGYWRLFIIFWVTLINQFY
jgi:hypothetical protein